MVAPASGEGATVSHVVETKQQAIDDLKAIAADMARPDKPTPAPFVHWVNAQRFREIAGHEHTMATAVALARLGRTKGKKT